MSSLRSSFLLAAIFFAAASIAGAQESAPDGKPSAGNGISYGIVVDNSGTYRKMLEDLIQFVGKVLDEHKPDDEAFFIRFIDFEKIKLAQELTSDVTEIRDSSENMYVEGGQTAMSDAVLVAGDYLAENGKKEYALRRSILLVTDGDDRGSGSKPEQAIKVLKDAGIRLIAVAVSDDKVQAKTLERMARETGGKLFVLKHKGELRTVGSEVAAALRNP